MAKEGSVGPQMPSEARSGGQLNQSTPLDQRVPDRTTELSSGPKLGENGQYLPARYERTITTPDGKQHTMIVEDR